MFYGLFIECGSEATVGVAVSYLVPPHADTKHMSCWTPHTAWQLVSLNG